ncbi:hypothetical protein T439DRAFT_320723 [Meredithblackwellia eburnea MCA 4105]
MQIHHEYDAASPFYQASQPAPPQLSQHYPFRSREERLAVINNILLLARATIFDNFIHQQELLHSYERSPNHRDLLQYDNGDRKNLEWIAHELDVATCALPASASLTMNSKPGAANLMIATGP